MLKTRLVLCIRGDRESVQPTVVHVPERFIIKKKIQSNSAESTDHQSLDPEISICFLKNIVDKRLALTDDDLEISETRR